MRPNGTFRRLTVTLIAASTLVGLAAAGLSAGAAIQPGRNWTVYHGNAEGSGVAPGIKAVTTAKRAWSSRALDGELYGEPTGVSEQRVASRLRMTLSTHCPQPTVRSVVAPLRHRCALDRFTVWRYRSDGRRYGNAGHRPRDE